MANPLIPMEQAANILGLSVEKLTELRSNNEIFGYRDGMSWKFKMSELERVATELEIEINRSPIVDISDSVIDLAGESGIDLGSGLGSSDVDLADSQLSIGSGPGDSIIGDPLLDEPVSGTPDDDMLSEDSATTLIQESSSDLIEDDSSVEIKSRQTSDLAKAMDVDDDLLHLQESVEDMRFDDSGELNLQDSGEINLDSEDALSFGSSSLENAAGSSKKLAAEDTGDLLDEVEAGTGDSPSDTSKMLADNDDMLLSEDDLFSDDLSLGESGSFDSAALSSDFEDSGGVMEDSDSSSELVFDSMESGINLSANESGISLDEGSFAVGGSDIDSLELPDDDMIVLENPADMAAQTMMQEDDFNLTPLEENFDDDTSGSQVIALEDSEIYADESSATMLGDADMVAEPAMIEDGGGMYDDGFGGAGYGDPNAGLAPMGVGAAPVIPEAPFSIWQTLSLVTVAALLCTGGMIAYDICRNMWLPEGSVVSTGVLPFFLDLFNIGN